jgi:integrase/recombinase XerD
MPNLLIAAGNQAVEPYLELFSVSIRNESTREAYSRAVREFLGWCDREGLRDMQDIQAKDVRKYVGRPRSFFGNRYRSTATNKQHMAAIRRFFKLMTEKKILAMNPAEEVETSRLSPSDLKTKVFLPGDVQKILASIDTSHVVGKRDRALLAILAYTFARVSTVTRLHVKDYFEADCHFVVRFTEKSGKKIEIPVHHKLKEILDLYLEASGLKSQPDAFLFPVTAGQTRRLTTKPMTRIGAARMLQRRLDKAGLASFYTAHSFRSSGITNFLENGGTLEVAQRIAGHADSRTTKLYRTTNLHDSREHKLSVEDVEHIRY